MDTFSNLLPYVNFGVLGLLVVALLTGFLYTKGYVDEMRERHKAEVEEYKRALELERQRNEIGELSAHLLRELVNGLRKEITLCFTGGGTVNTTGNLRKPGKNVSFLRRSCGNLSLC